MHIEPTKFLKEKSLEIKYDANSAICRKCPSLNQHDNHEEKATKEAIYKDNNKETPKQRVKQIRKKKQ